MSSKTTNLFIAGIIVFGFILRIYMLGSVPAAASLDEASIGYNAYSLLKTGADEFGTRFPLLLRAYDDWRPGAYAYLAIPAVWVFGLSVFAVRLPSVLLSMMTLVVTYACASLFFSQIKQKNKRVVPIAALSVLLLMTISPWHIYLSRLGHEVNLGHALTIGGVYLFLLFVTYQDKRMLIGSAIVLALSMYGYQSQKLVVPVVVLAGIGIFWNVFKKNIRTLCVSGVTAAVVVLPMLIVSLAPDALVRLSATSAFVQTDPYYRSDLSSFVQAKESGNIIGQIVYNRRLTPMKIFIRNYVSHMDPAWLFNGGPKENHKVPGLGLLWAWEAVLVAAGLVGVWKSGIGRRYKWFLVTLILSAPIPAAISTQAPHAMRAFTMVPWIQLLEGFGIIFLAQRVRIRWLMAALGVLAAISVFRFAGAYYDLFARTHAGSFQYAAHDAMEYVARYKDEYDSVIISNRDQLSQSYMFYLFSQGVDPAAYQTAGGTGSGGFAEEHIIDGIYFGPVQQSTETGKILYVVNPGELPDDARLVETFTNRDDAGEVVVGIR